MDVTMSIKDLEVTVVSLVGAAGMGDQVFSYTPHWKEMDTELKWDTKLDMGFKVDMERKVRESARQHPVSVDDVVRLFNFFGDTEQAQTALKRAAELAQWDVRKPFLLHIESAVTEVVEAYFFEEDSKYEEPTLPVVDGKEGVNSVPSPYATQTGGAHYKGMGIQPGQYADANNLNWQQKDIVKYVSRYANKNGVEDLLKAIDTARLLIFREYGKGVTINPETNKAELVEVSK